MAKETRWLIITVLVNCYFLGSFGSLHDPQIISSRLNESSDEIVLNAPEELHLICRGNHPIVWKYQNYKVSGIIPDLYLTSWIDKEKVHWSELKYIRTNYKNTGYYICYYENSTDQENEQKSTKIYVYVFDPENLFVDKDFYHPMHQHKQTSIPCRTTHPNINVILYKNNAKVNMSMDYNPREGFLVDYPNQRYNGEFECVGHYFNITQSITLELLWHRNTSETPPVEIIGPTLVLLNETLTLECRTKVKTGDLLQFIWTFPYNSSRVIIEEKTERKIYNNTSYNSAKEILTVQRSELSDEGFYNCTVIDHSDKVNSTSIFVKIRAKEAPSFHTTSTKNNSVIAVPYNSFFQFNCNATGTPNPTLTWYKDGNLLNPTMKSIHIIANNTKLIIPQVTNESEGVYTCTAANIAGEASIHSNLTISYIIPQSKDYRQEKELPLGVITAIIVTLVVIAILLGVFIRKIHKQRRERRDFAISAVQTFKKEGPGKFNPDLPLDEQVDLLPYKSQYEFPKDKLQLGKTLGQGAFGRVVKATAFGILNDQQSTTVAVKILKGSADYNQLKVLIQELKIMIHLEKHLNVINLLGAVTKDLNKGQMFLIMEFCRYGSLRHFLLKHRKNFVNQLDRETGELQMDLDPVPIGYQNASTVHNENNKSQSNYVDHSFLSSGSNSPEQTNSTNTNETDFNIVTSSESETFSEKHEALLRAEKMESTSNKDKKTITITTLDLVSIAFQIANGMEYLASKKLIHRDLAARNILLADDYIVKICDFGLAKNLYKYSNYHRKGNGPLPIKWMALESIRYKIFSSQSDVWSFGIVLWELFTLGGTPYPAMEADGEFYKKLKHGYRMDQPEYASNTIYSIMRNCWLDEPNSRPSFSQLVKVLGQLLRNKLTQKLIDQDGLSANLNSHMSLVQAGNGSSSKSPEYVNIPSGQHFYLNTEKLESEENKILQTEC